MTRARKWIKPLARAGYSSRGLVYAIVGVFAILAAFGAGSKKNTEDALLELLRQPFGTALVALLIIGLVGYVVWRLIQSLLDTDDHGWSPKGLAVRAGLLASASTYATLALYALSLLGVFSFRSGGGQDSNAIADAIAGIIGTSYVSLGLSLIFAGVAIAHWWKAGTRRYADHFRAGEMAMVLIHPVSIVGLAARGTVFAIISLLLFYRFLDAGPSTGETPGIKEAMQFLQDQPFGKWLLLALGVGVVLFAAYSFAEAVWRKINIEDAWDNEPH